MEVIVKITNEQLLNLIMNEKNKDETNEKVIEEPIKRGRGRPRVHPMKDPNAPRRPVGRPKKYKMNLQN